MYVVPHFMFFHLVMLFFHTANPEPGTGSRCSPGCIAGIVLAIIGAAIMAVVVALVVYAVYSYLSNPATKLAKAGTEGLNG